MASEQASQPNDNMCALGALMILVLMIFGGLIYTYWLPQQEKPKTTPGAAVTDFPDASDEADSEGTSKVSVETSLNSALDEFYRNARVASFQDLRNLPENYNRDQAKSDGCVVVDRTTDSEQVAREARSKFMQAYQKHQPVFVRLYQTTVEGDPILMDILYTEQSEIQIVKDSTRDRFAAPEDRQITLKTYENIGYMANESGNPWWVAYDDNWQDATPEAIIWILPS